MKWFITISSNDPETAYNAMRLANLALIKKKQEVGVFMLGKAVEFPEFSTEEFNVAVLADEFMEAALKNKDWELINPRTGEVVNKVKAKSVLDLMASMAWQTGDPGIINLSAMNRGTALANPLLKKRGVTVIYLEHLLSDLHKILLRRRPATFSRGRNAHLQSNINC